jgi:Flp pilus assembly protein TadD
MRRAIEVGGHYVALRPRSYAVMGHIFRLRENYVAAEEAFIEALKFNRDHPEWMHALADVQIAQGKIPDARKTLFRLHHTHPDVVDSEESARLRQLIEDWNEKKRRFPRQNPATVPD